MPETWRCSRTASTFTPSSCRAPNSERRSPGRSISRSCIRFWPGGGSSTRTIRRSPISAKDCTAIGERDTQVQLLRAATSALGPIDKARKWLVTRDDLDYAALWILYAATPLAQVEVIGARLLADREVILQALKLNPAFFQTVYVDLLNAKKTRHACAGGAGRGRPLPGRAGRDAVPAGDRSSARGRRSAVAHRDREPLHAPFRRQRRDRGLRVPGRPGADRQGVAAGPAHEDEATSRCRNWRLSTRNRPSTQRLAARPEGRALQPIL